MTRLSARMSSESHSVHLCGPWGLFTVMVANETVADGDRYPANVLSVTEHALVYCIDSVSSS